MIFLNLLTFIPTISSTSYYIVNMEYLLDAPEAEFYNNQLENHFETYVRKMVDDVEENKENTKHCIALVNNYFRCFRNVMNFTQQLLEFDLNPVFNDRNAVIFYLEKIKENARNKYVCLRMYNNVFIQLKIHFPHKNRHAKNLKNKLKRNVIKCGQMMHELSIFVNRIDNHIYNLK